MDTVTTPAARRDFFICHAHEDKAAVARPLQQLLEARGHSVWLDETELTVGDSLRRCIDHGLANCRFGIVVLSPAFFAKEWPQYELDGLMERQTSEGVKVVLPVWHGVDHAAVATRSPSLANLVAATTEWGIGPVVDQLVRAFVATTAEPAPAPAAPRDAGPVPGQPLRFPLPDAARAQLLADRPDFWEYFLFADSLARGLRAHEAAWRDHQLRLVRPTGRSLGKEEIPGYVGRVCKDMTALLENFNRLFAPAAFERAVGAPGEPGDPEAIEHLAERMTSVYGQWLDWAAEVRSTRRPEAFDHLLDLLARMPDRAIEQFRDFVERATRELGRIPTLVEGRDEDDEPIELELTLVLTTDEANDRAFHRELRRLQRRWKRL